MKQHRTSASVRPSVLYSVVAAAVLAAGLIVVSRNKRPSETPVATEESGATPAKTNVVYQRPKPLHAVTGPGHESTEPTPSAPPAATQATPPTTLPGPQPNAETRGIVSALANIDLKSKPFTATDAAALKEGLHHLAQSGPAGVGAIQEYLALNKDVSFESVAGVAASVGSPSLRLALLETLGQMAGPEALALATSTLASSSDPREIALLAQNLEKQAPGQYRDAAMAAARGALGEASAGRLEGKDVGPLFGVLANYGGATAVADFQQAAGGPWKYYATIALANLPDGAGLPALQQIITDPQNSAASSRVAALQAAAQLSADNADARNLLLDQARKGTIPAATWINVAAALAGDQFSIGTKSAEANPNLRTWHLSYGNQNYYAQPATLTPEQIQQRLGLFDQFLNVAANNPAAVAALQNARSTLSNRLPIAQ